MHACGGAQGSGGSPLSHARPSWRKGLVALTVLALSLVCAGATWGATVYDPALDPYSMANTSVHAGASAWWAAGYTGKGVDVAVIDSGVSAVQGLATDGKIVYGPDLSLESQNVNLRNKDTYGHGTFMAGLIAGKDADLVAPYALAPSSAYRGIAPDARIVSLKVATADGGVDVSQVIAAINWVVQHKNSNELNIRVLNLSYGTNSLQPYEVDPLSFAVEQAWKSGIVVVAAAGNSGFQKSITAQGLANPAYNPYVLAVGGSDSKGTATVTDDQPGEYSATSALADAARAPDLLAFGSHLQGLRVPNSYLDAKHPEGRLGERYFRGSGTSQAAAITSGAVALVLQKYPSYTPDQVKALLRSTAAPLANGPTDFLSAKIQGEGELALAPALSAPLPRKHVQSFPSSSGTGTLEGARGSDHLSRDGVVLRGEQDIFGKPFDSAAMAGLAASRTSWSGGNWNGSTWSGSTWSGSTWSGSTWSGSTWSGSTWSGSTWSGNTWSGNTWSGSTWSGSSWSGSTWSGNTWSGGSWLGATWG